MLEKVKYIKGMAQNRGPKAVSRAGASLGFYVSANVRKRSRSGVFGRLRTFRSRNTKGLPQRPPKKSAQRHAKRCLVAPGAPRH